VIGCGIEAAYSQDPAAGVAERGLQLHPSGSRRDIPDLADDMDPVIFISHGAEIEHRKSMLNQASPKCSRVGLALRWFGRRTCLSL
jgi:hypothetical protein